MKITDKFIFVHLPKAGGTWVGAALGKVHLKMLEQGSIVGRMIVKLMPWISSKKQKLQIESLVLFEYGHRRLSELPGNSMNILDSHPYKRRRHVELLLGTLKKLGLLKQTPPVGMLLRHTRLSQLPAQIRQNKQIVTCISNPLRWHISRFNYYKLNCDKLPHLLAMQQELGEFNDFRKYCTKQMMAKQNIYYLGYLYYLNQNPQFRSRHKAGSGQEFIDEYRYPDETFHWWEKAKDPAIKAPQHYGLLSILFFMFLSPEPWRQLSLSPSDYASYLNSPELKKDFGGIHFLGTENLNQATHDFLLSNGYPPQALAFIKNMKPLNVSTEDAKLSSYYDKELAAEIHNKERLIFTLFPEYEEAYQTELAKLPDAPSHA